jgi:hypothetical protein
LSALGGVLAVQQHHLMTADRGFSTTDRVWIGILADPDHLPPLDEFVMALARQPAITHWAFSESPPARATEGRVETVAGEGRRQALMRVTSVSPGFFDTYGMTMLAGRPQLTQGESAVVIDARAARTLGFATPQAAVGAVLRAGGGWLQAGDAPRRVVGVVKDVTLESAHHEPMPQVFEVSDQPMWDLSVSGTDIPAMLAAIESTWQAHGPPVPHEVMTADDQRADVYRQEQQLTTVLLAVAALATGVAMLGAYTLVADTLRRRRTELVLRRLHGAGDAAIAREVAREFIGPFTVGAAIALPAAAWLGSGYLAGFVDRVGLLDGVVLPLVVACAVMALAVAVAAARHVRLALALEPVEALR